MIKPISVKRWRNSGKEDFCEDGVKPARKAGKAAAGGRIAARQEAVKASEGRQHPTGSARRENDNRRRK